MGKIIAVANQKGGVGKTTTAVNVAACLGELKKGVLLVDLDPQGNASSGIGASISGATAYEVLTGGAVAGQAVVPSAAAGVSVMPSDIRLAAAEVELVNVAEREFAFQRAIAPLKKDYHTIIIDCPPSLGLLTLNALTAADSVLIPIQCEYYALEGVTALLNTIHRVQRSVNRALDIEGVLLTMYDGRTNLSLQVAAEVKKHFRGKVFSAVIPRTVRLGEAPSHGLPITQYDERSAGTEAYRAVAKELMKHHRGYV